MRILARLVNKGKKNPEDRIQKTESRIQNSEFRIQKTEDRRNRLLVMVFDLKNASGLSILDSDF